MFRFLNVALTLSLALFFSLLGIFGFLIAFSSSIQTQLIALILDNFWSWCLFGLGFLMIGIAFFAYTFHACKKTYLSSKIGPHLTTVNEDVIHAYLHSYFEKLFPETPVSHRFFVKKNKIQIAADLPYVPEEQQKDLLKVIETDLFELFNETIGYHKQLELSLEFDKAK